MANTLSLGVSRKIITPKVGVRLAGYVPYLYSESVNDDLTVSAFYFEDEGEKALLLSASLSGIGDPLDKRIRGAISTQFGIPYGAIIDHAFHTHSGPTVNDTPGWGNAENEYIDEILLPRILEAVGEAIDKKEPVTMSTARGESLVGVNRREITPENTVTLGQNPWAPFDPRMTILSFKNEKGERVASIVHYGAHATASGRNKQITRDWPGPMIDTLDENLGGITAFFNGPEGDVGPRLATGRTAGGFLDGKSHSDVKYALRHGATAAADAIRIARTESGFSPVRLTVSEREIRVPVKKRISKDEALAIYEENKNYTVNLPAKKRAYALEVLESYENGYTEIDARPFIQTAVKIGDAVFLSFPFELFSEIGLRISRASDIPYTLCLALSNGIGGYFPTESELNRCASPGYEVDSFKVRTIQPYTDNADLTLIKESISHLKSLGYNKVPEKPFELDENATK